MLMSLAGFIGGFDRLILSQSMPARKGWEKEGGRRREWG
jgi:hypothetical protein